MKIKDIEKLIQSTTKKEHIFCVWLTQEMIEEALGHKVDDSWFEDVAESREDSDMIVDEMIEEMADYDD
jgi:hypothetical protein